MTATRPRRWFNLAALASAVLLACTVALWLAGFFLDPEEYRLSVTDFFRVGVRSGWDGPTFGRLIFFNIKDGPYICGTIALSDGPGESHPRYLARGWDDSFGVYFHHFYFFDSGKTVWDVDDKSSLSPGPVRHLAACLGLASLARQR